MTSCVQQKFWLEHFSSILQSVDCVVPRKGLSDAANANAATRFVVIITVLTFVITGNTHASLVFFCVAITLIIIIYFLRKKHITLMIRDKHDSMTIRENFKLREEKLRERRIRRQEDQYYDQKQQQCAAQQYRQSCATNEPFTADSNAYPPLCGSDADVAPMGARIQYKRTTVKDLLNRPSSCDYCNDEVVMESATQPSAPSLFNSASYVSPNQKLAGAANPKTAIPPVIVPPPTDFEYWRAGNLTVPTAINEETNIDVYGSGYQVSTCCAPTYTCDTFAIPAPPPIQQRVVPVCSMPELRYGDLDEEGRNRVQYAHADAPRQDNRILDYDYSGGVREKFEMPSLSNPNVRLPDSVPTPQTNPMMCGQNSSQNSSQNNNRSNSGQSVDGSGGSGSAAPKRLTVRPNKSGWVNLSCGYNPSQLYTAGLPVNVAMGNCMQQPEMKEFNENLFTQTVQPGVYTYNQVNEPVNANMGISFTQQFEPRTCKTNPINGDVFYTEHDPRIIEPVPYTLNMDLINAASEGNIYDPRFTGYGTSYRSYTDDQLGQTKYYYDDVNAIRMPNYIVRSNIDHQPFADQYGPIKAGDENGNKFTSNIHALANNAFLDGSLQHRTELQERLMRKINAQHWQKRMAPIHTGGQRMMGGMSLRA